MARKPRKAPPPAEEAVGDEVSPPDREPVSDAPEPDPPGDREDFEVPGGEQFITSEELQTLGEVLGHFSDFSEQHDDDPASLGVPSHDLSAVHTELRGLRSSIEELLDAATAMTTIKPLLAEIKSDADVRQHRRDILTSSLSALSEDMHEVRLQVRATSKSALESAESMRRMSRQTRWKPSTVVRTITEGRPEWPILLVGFVLLPLTWAAAFYLKTGDLRTAVGGLILANLAICGTMFLCRPRS